MRAVALAQLGKLATESNSTLHNDGTTKFGKVNKLSAYTPSGQYTVSINEVLSGSAEHTLDLLQQVVKEVNTVGGKTGRPHLRDELISSIKNTMTDRATVTPNSMACCQPTGKMFSPT